jgi:energy-coupling factor transport system permease protein
MFAVSQFRVDTVILWQWRFLTLTGRSLKSGLLLMGRFMVIVTSVSLFTFSTSTTELSHGIEHLLRPLQKVRFPAHETALVFNITIRFIPILLEETERIMKAQASRGASFGTGRMNIIRRFVRLLPLFVPIFLVSLRHAQNLGEAMESRCYLGGEGRTHLVQLRAERRDYAVLMVGVAVAGIAIITSRYDMDGILFEYLKSAFA